MTFFSNSTLLFIPDLIEVPGGGKSLQTIRNIKAKGGPLPGGSGIRPSTSGISKPKTIDLTRGKHFS